jgi:hypothetical protein
MTHLHFRHAARCTSFVAPFLLTLSWFAAGIIFAAAVGDQVELHATHQAGVPWH